MHLPLAAVGVNHVEHVENDGQVAEKQGAAQNADPAKQFAYLPWKQEASRNESDPFGPGATLPKAVGFAKAQHSVGKGHASSGPQTGIGHAVGKIQKELSPSATGSNVQTSKETLRDQPDVFMQEGDGAGSHRDYENTLEKLEGGNGPEDAPLAAVIVGLGEGVAHERWR